MSTTRIDEVAAAGDSVDGENRKAKKGMAIKSLADLQAIIQNLLYDGKNQTVTNAFVQIEQKTNIKREHITYVLAGLVTLYMIFGAFARLLCNFIGFAYPAYASVKAIRTAQKDDDTHWLIYWTVFATFTLVDFFAENLFYYFPIYWVAKALFLLYLYLPQTYGALVLYDRVVDPTISKIDELIQSYREQNEKKQ